MPPNFDESNSFETAGLKPISEIDILQKSGDVWLDGKRKADGAEGYWRIHDDLYDLNGFVKYHPGGAQWLELTKGTDITEAFEVHHLDEKPRSLLPKFHVKSAETPRNSPYTFHENGFYRTLKKRILPFVAERTRSKITMSAVYTDSLLILTFALSIMACRNSSYLVGICAGYVLSCLTVAAHNYFHQADNVRMYYFNLSLLSFREWRISHALSHHLFTNTVVDLEMLLFRPFLEFFPIGKGAIYKYASWIYSPILWAALFHISVMFRLINVIRYGDTRSFGLIDLIPYVLPTAMYIFGGQQFLPTLAMWAFIVAIGSFKFVMVGVNAGHHHPDVFHDGDEPRKDKDWGLQQLDTVVDRTDVTGSHFLVLTSFGDHTLHHLFPTLDQGLLDSVYPIFKATMKEFDVDLRMTTSAALIKASFTQLARTQPNPNPPNLYKKLT